MKITILCGVILPSEIVKKSAIEHYKFANEYLVRNIDSLKTFSDDEVEYIKKFYKRPFNTFWIHKCSEKLLLVRNL